MNDQTTTAEKPKYTKEFFKQKLSTDSRWAIKGMLAIYKYQTEQEKMVDQTVEDNGVGFSGCHGEIFSSFSKQYLSKGWLSDKQTAIVMKGMPKYAGQLIRIVNGNQ